MDCNKNHRYLPEHKTLPESQDNKNDDRHTCAGCAYAEGLRDALTGSPKKLSLAHLPSSQAGTVRHKGAIEAYQKGYSEGVRFDS